MPKIIATMIIYNEEEYLPYSLQSIYNYVDKIIIIEGAIQKLIINKIAPQNGRSIDKTNEILSSFPDPNKKIIIEHGIYKHKNDQRNKCLKYVSPGDWILLVDGDEIYSETNIKTLISLPEKHKTAKMIIYPMYHFYDFDKHIEMIKYVERFFLFEDGMHYQDCDTGQAIRDKNNNALWIHPKYAPYRIIDNNTFCHHYSRMKSLKAQVERSAYYYMRDSGLKLEDAMKQAQKDPTANHSLPLTNYITKYWDHKNHPKIIKNSEKYKNFLKNKNL